MTQIIFKQLRVLKAEEQREYYVYYQIKMPWPLEKRDLINRVVITRNPTTDEGVVNMEAIATYLPEKDGIIRMKEAKGFYKIERAEGGKTKFTYQYYADLQGVPAWIANAFITDTPFETLQKLRKETQKAKYQ